MSGRDDFFRSRPCDRCGSDDAKEACIMSWFTEERICMECSVVEDQIKEKLSKKYGPELARRYEGCGRVPTLKEYSEL